jgi:1-acyl-sn-glycerol-3-phosphate acyltransferase
MEARALAQARRPPPTSQYRLWLQRVIWLLFWLLTRLMRADVCGAVPSAPCIIVSNHLNYVDIPIAGRYVVRYGERVHWLAKVELFRVPFIGSILRAMQTVSINREQADRRAVEHIVAYAREDKVWIFPEGHRSHTGRLQPGKEGVALIARLARVPIVPVGIAGTERGLWPLLTHQKTLGVRIGEPFLLSSDLSRSAALELVMSKIAALLPPAYRGV